MTDTNNRQARRAELAKQLKPLLNEFIDTYRNDESRPDFAHSELGLALKIVMLVLGHYAEVDAIQEIES